MFTQPELMTGTNAYRATTPAPLQRLNARRAGYVERTIVTSDGVRLAVRDYGSTGAREHTIVLLHGLCLTQESWMSQVRHLTRRWGNSVRIITYDHRGHGESTGADMRTYRIDRLAADLADVLTALRVSGPLTLAGHSMGGMTALAYLSRPAADRPVEPQGLILIATAAGRLAERGIGRLLNTRATEMVFELVHHMPRRAVDKAVTRLVRPLCDGLTRYAGASWQGAAALTASAVRTTPLTTAAGFLPALKRYNEYGALSSIVANTIVISGGADLATPVAHARDMVAAIPGAAHLHQPDAGHMLLQEHPKCVNAAIDHILEMQTDSTLSAAS